MELTEIEQKRVVNTVKRMVRILNLAFRGKSNLFIGFYALLTAQFFIREHLAECESVKEFIAVKTCILKNLAQFTQEIYGFSFTAGGSQFRKTLGGVLVKISDFIEKIKRGKNGGHQ